MAGIRDGFIVNLGRWAGKLPPGIMGLPSNHRVIFPFYHAVSHHPLPHIDPLYSVKSSTQFISDLNYLLKYYKPIDLPTLIDHINGVKVIKIPSFFLSFDDGLREFYEVIAPILIKKGIPAICFLNSGFIDNRDLFFRYKVGLLVEEYRKTSEWANTTFLQKWRSIHDSSEDDLPTYLLNLGYDQISQINELADLMDLDFDLFLREQKPYLTTAQVNELINQGFYFGGHSIDHPQYQYLDEAEQIRQTVESIDMVKQRFDLNYSAFAFPFTDYGVERSFFDKITQAIHPDLLMGGAGLKRESQSNHVQRISMERGDLTAREIIHGELLYHCLSSVFGKDKIRRT